MIKFITALLLLFSCVLRAQNITYVEYFFDSDPGFNNAISIPFSASPTVSITSHSISTAALGGGFHTFYLRAKDQNGNWSVLNSRSFYKTPGGGPALPNVTKLEYFIDNDPGFGAATNVAITPGTNVIQNGIVVDISSVAGGFHTLYVRAKDANGNWSVLNAKAFYKTPGGGPAL
ncbi:hypothetical protein F9K33_12630, partial [bacterium]